MTYLPAAQTATDVQDACNLSGVAFSFAEAMRAVCDESQRLGKGTAIIIWNAIIKAKATSY